MNKTLKEKPEKKELSYKQQAFINAYVTNGFNATAAALMAGYSQKTAQEQASRLLSKVIIKQAIEAKQAASSQQAGITALWLEQQLIQHSQQDRPAEQLRALEMLCRHCPEFFVLDKPTEQPAGQLTAEQTAELKAELKAIASRLTKPAVRLVQPEGKANAG